MTLLGYEVIESPNNLNFSRGYLFTLAIPLTTTGALLSYTFSDWFSATAGVILGWDDSKNVNDPMSYTGQFAFTPMKDFTANLNWVVGPEQVDPRRFGNVPRDAALLREQPHALRARLRLPVHRNQEPDAGAERGLRARADRPLPPVPRYASGYRLHVVGLGGSTARTTGRRSSGRRSGRSTSATRRAGAPDSGTRRTSGPPPRPSSTRSGRGWSGRLEYRHDQADEKVFRVRYSRPDIASQGLLARGQSMDTFSISLIYSFF